MFIAQTTYNILEKLYIHYFHCIHKAYGLIIVTHPGSLSVHRKLICYNISQIALVTHETVCSNNKYYHNYINIRFKFNIHTPTNNNCYNLRIQYYYIHRAYIQTYHSFLCVVSRFHSQTFFFKIQLIMITIALIILFMAITTS